MQLYSCLLCNSVFTSVARDKLQTRRISVFGQVAHSVLARLNRVLTLALGALNPALDVHRSRVARDHDRLGAGRHALAGANLLLLGRTAAVLCAEKIDRQQVVVCAVGKGCHGHLGEEHICGSLRKVLCAFDCRFTMENTSGYRT